jgi:hypothetical protein
LPGECARRMSCDRRCRPRMRSAHAFLQQGSKCELLAQGVEKQYGLTASVLVAHPVALESEKERSDDGE